MCGKKTKLKNIIDSERGHAHRIGPMPLTVYRLLPMKTRAVGAFVFLDRFRQDAPVPAAIMEAGPTGELAHPHRGIATVTYMLEGSIQHFDSRGHSGAVDARGVQWMKAGCGIVHDEWGSLDTDGTRQFDGLQFWINLQPEGKAEEPAYRAVQASELPVLALPGNAGNLRVVIGEHSGELSPIPRDSTHFLYHLRLNPDACTSFAPAAGHEVAAYIANGRVAINGQQASQELLHFDSNDDGKLRIQNGDAPADIILFGGEHYAAPIVSGAQYVMNTQEELRTAFADYASGAYGVVDYSSYQTN